MWSPFEDLSYHCHFSLQILRAILVTCVRLRSLLFRILLCREVLSIALPITFWATRACKWRITSQLHRATHTGWKLWTSGNEVHWTRRYFEDFRTLLAEYEWSLSLSLSRKMDLSIRITCPRKMYSTTSRAKRATVNATGFGFDSHLSPI